MCIYCLYIYIYIYAYSGRIWISGLITLTTRHTDPSASSQSTHTSLSLSFSLSHLSLSHLVTLCPSFLFTFIRAHIYICIYRYGVVQVLRLAQGGNYSSNQIIGQPVSLAAYCDNIANAGVLVSDPGTFSYVSLSLSCQYFAAFFLPFV